jgi:hypothetical protein
MNKLTLLVLFLLLFINAKAQDKIISINQDTIHCKIVSISNERIFYELNNNDGSITGKSMPLFQVAEYLKLHQPETNSNTDKPESSRSVSTPENRFCLGLDAGYSTMPWYLDNLPLSSAMPDYYDRLKAGFHINGSAHYMITSFLGLGAEYSFFKTYVSGSMPIEYASSVFITESEECRQYINYLGASVLFQQHLDARQKFTVSESVSAGILFLRLEDQSTYPDVSYSGYSDIANNLLLTGNSFSAKFGLAAGYRLSESVSVGLGGDFIWCSLKKASFESRGSNNYSYSSEKEELSEPLKLSRIDCSFVLHYCF